MTEEHKCDQWCKVHWYWDFHEDQHVPYPQSAFWRQDNAWARILVYVGPPAYYPKKPVPSEWSQMGLVCPHEQIMLTCNFCLRHMFRPIEV
jgi:hypothetical protein